MPITEGWAILRPLGPPTEYRLCRPRSLGFLSILVVVPAGLTLTTRVLARTRNRRMCGSWALAIVAPDVTADLAVASSPLAFPFPWAFRQT